MLPLLNLRCGMSSSRDLDSSPTVAASGPRKECAAGGGGSPPEVGGAGGSLQWDHQEGAGK